MTPILIRYLTWYFEVGQERDAAYIIGSPKTSLRAAVENG